MAMSDYLEAIVLQSSLNAVAFPAIPSVWVALYTSATDDAGGGTEVPTGGGTLYVRQQITADFTVTGVATRASNASLIEFPVAGAGWGTITHIAVRDAVTGGNLLYHGVLAGSQVILINQIFQIPIGTLGITVGATPA